MLLGLIPARAGKTARFYAGLVSIEAHPRAGGENPAMLGSSLQLFGSSPRGRGKRAYSTPTIFSQRLIPARAGKTRGRPGAARANGAHPRAGGENVILLCSWPSTSGSSPRGRGKHQGRRVCRRRMGLIPARAGKTSSISPTSWPTWAHPRAGGENVSNSAASICISGSSPRGRGKRRPRRGHVDAGGLIPARAGKTSRPREGAGCRTAHPRAGGENFCWFCW